MPPHLTSVRFAAHPPLVHRRRAIKAVAAANNSTNDDVPDKSI
jgi:hypothetical protein